MSPARRRKDPRVTKRCVTMTNFVVVGVDDDGAPVLQETTAVDYVRPDHLEAYVADARTRWTRVDVSEEPDAGPAGYEGATYVPDHLPLPDAGTTYEAIEKEA